MQRWQKFEHLVARIHEALDGAHYTVEHDVTVIEPGGAEAQIDVVLTPKSAFVGRILISCKSSGAPVGIGHVREWASIVHETGAAAGVIVSPTGFTADAIEAARATTRRVSLWFPRPLTDADFAPDDEAPEGYLKSIHTTMRARVLRPREETFTIDVEPIGERKGITVTSRFSAATRDGYYLRDEQDNVVGNLWDEYIAAGEKVTSSGEARVEFAESRFLVIAGYRVRFRALSVYIEVGHFELAFETDFSKLAFAYENAVTGDIKTVPLPASLLDQLAER
jgi:hypothetical protein